jgi:polysaccharide biosynthesis/export protein
MRVSSVFFFLSVFVVCLAFAGGASGQYDPVPMQSPEDSGRDDAVIPRSGADAFVDATDAEIKDSSKDAAPPSRIEEMYAERVTDAPRQFGYEIFAVEAGDIPAVANVPMGAVQDDFILGIGDELQVAFSGQRNTQARYKIDSQGVLMIEDFPPLMAAGLTMGALKESIERASSGLHNTQAYVSLSSVRQIGVLVVGHVEKPGQKQLTVFHTVLDALMQAGGVSKDGSLRQIKLVRGQGGQMIDLYDLLILGGMGMDLRLRDGDRIVVPPIGATVAVSGAVKRTGIFELKSDSFKGLLGQHKGRIGLRDMLLLGGGVMSAGQNRFMHLGLTEKGYEEVAEVTEKDAPVFGDGSILVVARGKEMKTGEIELLGHTRKVGLHDLSQHPTLGSVFDDPQVLGDDIYPLIGVIERWNAQKLSSTYLSYSIRSVLKKESDEALRDGDKIYLFSNAEISKDLSEKSNETDNIKYSSTPGAEKATKKGILQENPAMISFLKERSVIVRGGVRHVGHYPVAQDVTLDDLIAAAGGLTQDADPANIEITSSAIEEGVKRQSIDLSKGSANAIVLRAGDAVRVMQKFRKMEEKGVLILGEVRQPGRYDVLPTDKVSDLIRRAGGLTGVAYPAGAIFSRESERRAEEARFRSAKQDMERSLAAAMQREKERPDAAQIEMARDLAQELGEAKALGRITVEANPEILAAEPELDMLLEAGDRLYIPKRPLTVRVSGEVLSPAGLQFMKDKSPMEYVREAGGFTYYADKSRVFVLYPDGRAQPVSASSWNHKPIKIPPGSTIIVPRDPKPFDFIESARDLTQILSNLAVTAILVDDLQE